MLQSILFIGGFILLLFLVLTIIVMGVNFECYGAYKITLEKIKSNEGVISKRNEMIIYNNYEIVWFLDSGSIRLYGDMYEYIFSGFPHCFDIYSEIYRRKIIKAFKKRLEI